MTDLLDKAQAIEEATRSEAIAASRSQQPKAKSNGICIDCDEPIEAPRLKVLPYAQRCLGCQETEEGRSRHG